MRHLNIQQLAKSGMNIAKQNSPVILTAIGVAGFIFAIAKAIKATPKALEKIEEEINRQDEELFIEAEKKGEVYRDCVEKISVKDTIKVTWKCYIPVAVIATLSTVCVIGGLSINLRRNAALATACTLTESAFREYKDKVVETIGENKEGEVRDSVVNDKFERDHAKAPEVIVTGKGKFKCYDAFTGREFESSADEIRRVENDLNRRMLSEHYISLNEFYYELGLKSTEAGDVLGWNLNDGSIDIHFTSILNEDDEPCLGISFHVAPRYDFQSLM